MDLKGVTICGQSNHTNICDDETTLEKIYVPPQSLAIKSCGGITFSDESIYNDDDEDMVEDHYVQESLSRLSSTENLDNFDESESISAEENREQYEVERTRNFVRNHMGIDIKLEPSLQKFETDKQTEERLKKAFTLQKALLKRSFTALSMTLHTNTRNTDKQDTVQPKANLITCSRIDIDLRSDFPPKADIKSYKKFSEQVPNVKLIRNEYEPSKNSRSVSIANVSNTLSSYGHLTQSAESKRWPMRHLTWSLSSTSRKRNYLHEHLHIDLGIKGITIRNKSRFTTDISRRTQSATSARQSYSHPASIESRPLKRPQTANLPYTGCRKNCDGLFEKLVSEPLANSDELYPNKSLLTTFHHGFRSFWPIGRKINVIKNKRPLELNSYSRAIERNQIPIKANQSTDILKRVPVNDVQQRIPVSSRTKLHVP